MASLKLQYYWQYVYHKSDKLQAKVLFTFWAMLAYRHMRPSCAMQGILFCMLMCVMPGGALYWTDTKHNTQRHTQFISCCVHLLVNAID